MKIFLSPIANIKNDEVGYRFDGEKVIAEFKGVEDAFDFSGFPNGVMPMFDEFGKETVKTELEINPILSAKREDGELKLELVNYIGVEARYEERFPNWIDATDYKPKETEEGDNG